MASVDDRIVQMQFDNASFEKKLDDTLKSLSNLEKSLKFEGAKQGLSDLQGFGDKFNLGNMSTTIEGVSGKFLAFGSIAFTVLSNITTKAMQTGEQIVKSLSLDLVLSGFKEYELNMNSIQTILSNTKADKTTLGDVTKALDELNTYADKTIYNFGQMTHNIGTFTAAGVDLKTSVQSIKGISNIAAISGANADQASSAMYQLSQALASGTLKLMDWNSVVNAGMGGEVFQKALFESGKALGTIKNVPIAQTFDEWKAAGNSFRGSLEQGWITADVLTTTLQGFTGEMTDAELAAKGFTAAQIAQIQEMGKTGVEAATKIRTLTQLIDTTKEAIGSGWSESFKIMFGNFNEATTLFTTINDSISKFISNSSDARNTLLQTWKDMGGRDLLIEGLRKAFQDFAEILKPIKDAFREIFPKTTAFDLMNLTKAFELLVIKLTPSKKTIEDIHSIFKGFFSVLQVGWEIIKEGIKFIGGLFAAFGAGSGSFLDFAAKIGDFFTELNNKLVEGEGIKNFFKDLGTIAEGAITFIKDLAGAIKDFFAGLGDSAAADVATSAVDRISARFDNLQQVFDKLSSAWEPIKKGFEKVIDVLDQVWSAISNWFEDLGRKLAAVIEPGDFDSVVDAVNVGLLGAIALLLKKFLDKGIKFDLGGGLFESVRKTFGELTGVLSAMQTQLKAGALEKIAIAVGILTASVLVLSMIDSAALTKALTAMAVGFGQLMASFAILTQISSGPKSAATFDMVATGLILLSGALVVLATALKIISTMSWDELAKGLVGVTALLTVISVAVIPLSANSSGLITAGIGLTALGVALNIMAVALKIFATMSWGEIGKGLTTVAGLLTAIVVAMGLMPNNLILTGPGLVAIATSMVILGAAMKIFATMSWEEIGKGLTVVAVALIAIGVAMNLMPASLPLTAAGLVLVGISLNAIGAALKIMGSMSWKEIARGLTALAGSLVILAVATNAMTGAIAGAVAIGIVAPALLLLAKVLEEFGAISWNDLIHGLAGIAATLTVLALASLALESAVLPMIGFGAALVLIGGGFALFGAGVALVAKGLEIIARTGAAAVKVLPDLIRALGEGIPAFMQGVALGFIDMAQTFADAAPVLIKSLVVIIGHILDGLVVLIPKLIIVMGEAIDGLIKYIATDGGPKLIQAGIELLLALLTGVRDNIKEVVALVADIIKNFLDAFAAEIPGITDSIAGFVVAIFLGVANAMGQIAGQLLFGIGVAFITGLFDGIKESTSTGPMKWFKELAGNILGWIGNVIATLWQKGVDLVTGLFGGITDKVKDVTSFFQTLAGNIIKWIGDALGLLRDTGVKIITGLWNGIKEVWSNVGEWFSAIPDLIRYHIPNPLTMLLQIGRDIIQGMWDGIKEIWHKLTGWISDAASHLPGFIKGPLGIGSPSKVFAEIGENIIAGLILPFEQDTSMESALGAFADKSVDTFRNSVATITESLGDIKEFSPVITPVLDLTEVKTGAQKISDYISTIETLPISASFNQAATIATSPSSVITPGLEDPNKVLAPVGGGVKFEQNIYAPTQLSTSDIYKQTRNQIAMAKEELSIP